MQTTKVFLSGNSQAVRLPKDYQVEDKELYINKIGSTIVLFPKDRPWEAFERSLGEFTDDFFAEGRKQPDLQTRTSL